MENQLSNFTTHPTMKLSKLSKLSYSYMDSNNYNENIHKFNFRSNYLVEYSIDFIKEV